MKLIHRLTPSRRRPLTLRLLSAIVGSLILLNGCASSQPAPDKSIWAAQTAIENAERARVSQHAAAEMMQARDFLNRANLAVSQEDMVSAEQLAQQSQVTTQLALARAELIKAQAINAEMTKSISQLEQEMQYNQGEQP